jgi:hypothetical protein
MLDKRLDLTHKQSLFFGGQPSLEDEFQIPDVIFKFHKDSFPLEARRKNWPEKIIQGKHKENGKPFVFRGCGQGPLSTRSLFSLFPERKGDRKGKEGFPRPNFS